MSTTNVFFFFWRRGSTTGEWCTKVLCKLILPASAENPLGESVQQHDFCFSEISIYKFIFLERSKISNQVKFLALELMVYKRGGMTHRKKSGKKHWKTMMFLFFKGKITVFLGFFPRVLVFSSKNDIKF